MTNVFDAAVEHLTRALVSAPSGVPVYGSVQRVEADLLARHPRYIYGAVIMCVCRNGAAGEICGRRASS
ncbi:hypothetical protein [Nonomuraea sp. NPDC049158]|uniref:hypothetical protein n=1 Tax=Nonomuraea sp. NPDC049158 TaxID=3155649 RepID=UPI0033C74CC0